LPEIGPKQEYAREDVRRMLGVSEQQLRAWERQGWIRSGEPFSFADLAKLRTLRKLRENRVPAQRIERAIASLKQNVSGVEDPLSELKLTPDGRRIAVQIAGQRVEPISGQILFDFDSAEAGGVRSFPAEPPPDPAVQERQAEFWFQRGLALEESEAPVKEAIEAYRRAVDLNPHAAGAWVNLGTIHYRMGMFAEAEQFYRSAIEADPTYPLAHFNLGNLYDEQGQVEKAENYYASALRLNSSYADAHFNLALLFERKGDLMRAVHHWTRYLKLDPSSSWAQVARKQLEKLREAAVIRSR
jgi:tetratricopeptide (TPR) repeat protein